MQDSELSSQQADLIGGDSVSDLISRLDIIEMLETIDCKDDMVKMDDLIKACNKLPTVNCDNCIWDSCIFSALDWDANIVRCKNCMWGIEHKMGIRMFECELSGLWNHEYHFCADGVPADVDVIKLIQNNLRRKGDDEDE